MKLCCSGKRASALSSGKHMKYFTILGCFSSAFWKDLSSCLILRPHLESCAADTSFHARNLFGISQLVDEFLEGMFCISGHSVFIKKEFARTAKVRELRDVGYIQRCERSL